LAGTNLEEGYSSLRQALYPNVTLPFRAHHTWGYDVYGDKKFVEFRRRTPDSPGESPALDFLGASLIVSTEPLPSPSKTVAWSGNAVLSSRPNALPRVTVVSQAVGIPSPEKRLDYLFGDWDPRQEVVLETTEGEGHQGFPKLKSWTDPPGRVEALGEGRGWLVYSGVYHPGWEAWANGKKTIVQRANHAFQGVPVPEGEWTVHLLYRPPRVRLGLWVTVMSVLMMVVFLKKTEKHS